MVKELHKDVSDSPELERLAEEVASSGDTVVLTKDGHDLATIAPTSQRRPLKPRELTAEEVAISKSAAGGWADVDADELITRVYEGRHWAKPRAVQ
jgi:antitoxin (DNA-binding transcriptional repressor) of toxin-antitoxin stability system